MGRTIITEKDVREAEAYLRSVEMTIKHQADRSADTAQLAVADQKETALHAVNKVQTEERRRRSWWKLTGRRRAEEERRAEELTELARAALLERVDDYTYRLLKYIPAESVALYLTLQGYPAATFS
jgi:hypothetical protein